MSGELFDWQAIRPGELRDALGLGPKQPLQALRANVPVPNDDFVKATWPVLRDRWLSTEAAVRRSVIEQLRRKKFGDVSLKIGTAASDLAYLRSCRNSAGMRSVVLSHLLAVGSDSSTKPDSIGTTVRRPSGRAVRPATRTRAAHRASDDRDWERFTRNLSVTLAQLELDQSLVYTRARPVRDRIRRT